MIEAANWVSGKWVPAAWHPEARGVDYNGSSYCFITPADFASPGARELASPAAILTQLVAPGSPVTIPANFFGIHAFGISNGARSFPAGFYCKWLRSHDASVSWADLQPNNGTDAIDWTGLDRWVAAAEAMGAEPIYTVMTTPTWASSSPTEVCGYNLGGAAPPTSMALLTNFVGQVATRYGSRIKYWEVRNETNILPANGRAYFWSGTNQQLADECKAINQTVKAIIPTAKIIGPSSVSWAEPTGSPTHPLTYCPTMLTTAVTGGGSVLKDWIDIFACHLYYHFGGPSQINLMMTRVRSVMSGAGIAAMPIFDTESGILDVQYTTGYPDALYAKLMPRHLLTVAVQGLMGSAWYGYDGASDKFGFLFRDPAIGSAYQALIKDLSGAIVTNLVQVSDGSLVGTYTNAAGTTKAIVV
jgi:hypothetical protein